MVAQRCENRIFLCGIGFHQDFCIETILLCGRSSVSVSGVEVLFCCANPQLLLVTSNTEWGCSVQLLEHIWGKDVQEMPRKAGRARRFVTCSL